MVGWQKYKGGGGLYGVVPYYAENILLRIVGISAKNESLCHNLQNGKNKKS